jgi:hypothetical protein
MANTANWPPWLTVVQAVFANCIESAVARFNPVGAV